VSHAWLAEGTAHADGGHSQHQWCPGDFNPANPGAYVYDDQQ
jgi:hypothetical protein